MATIRDVARLAGVSPSTASRALRGNPVISAKTRQRVETAMRQLNYVPNFSAQNLANNENNTIVVILPVDHHEIFTNPFFLQALQGINAKSTERNFMVAIATGIRSSSYWPMWNLCWRGGGSIGLFCYIRSCMIRW